MTVSDGLGQPLTEEEIKEVRKHIAFDDAALTLGLVVLLFIILGSIR